MKKLIIFLILFSFYQNSMAQSVAINTTATTANASSILDVSSTNKGLLLPRMTKAQKNAIASPATGLLVYQTSPDSVGFQYFDGSNWIWLDAFNTNGWKTTGNAATDTAVNFMGTTDNMPLFLKSNNQKIAQFIPQKRNYFIGNGSGTNAAALIGQIAIGDSAGANLNAGAPPGVLVGTFAGKKITSGFNNTMIGHSAGENTTSGGGNSFVGTVAGRSNITGAFNTFVGHFAADSVTIGSSNTAMGTFVMQKNKKGSFNSIIGFRAGVGSDSLVNASAFGALALVDTSNAFVLGSINGVNGATANVNVAIGTTKPKAALHVNRGNAGNSLTMPSNRISLFEDNTTNYLQLLSPDADETGIMAGNNLTLEKSSIRFANDSSINFRTGGSNERVTIQKNGNVGVGNVTPFVPLHVSRGALPGALYASNATAIFENSGVIGNASIQLMNNSNNDFSIFSGTEITPIKSSMVFKKDSSIYFSTGNSIAERISVSKSGFIGINNPVPKSLLHIATTGVNAASSYYFPENNLIVEDTSLNIAAGVITNATHLIANNNNASAIIAGSKQNPLTSSIVFRNDDRSIRFVTNASNANGSLTDVIIDSSGRVGIGFTNPATSLGVNGAVTFVQDFSNTINAASVTITVGNRTFFRVNSDAAPASRKLALTNGLFTGQILIVQCIATGGVNGFRIEDADGNIDITGATFNMLNNDTITFIWDGNEWVELHRSDN
jgi:hypothetical protein